MANYKPLMYSLILLFVLTFIVTATISAFSEVSTPNNTGNSFLIYLSDKISNGFNITIPFSHIQLFFITGSDWTFSVNPFAWFGSTFQNYLLISVNSLTYIPSIIITPFILLFTFAFIWSIVALLKPVS